MHFRKNGTLTLLHNLSSSTIKEQLKSFLEQSGDTIQDNMLIVDLQSPLKFAKELSVLSYEVLSFSKLFKLLVEENFVSTNELFLPTRQLKLIHKEIKVHDVLVCFQALYDSKTLELVCHTDIILMRSPFYYGSRFQVTGNVTHLLLTKALEGNETEVIDFFLAEFDSLLYTSKYSEASRNMPTFPYGKELGAFKISKERE